MQLLQSLNWRGLAETILVCRPGWSSPTHAAIKELAKIGASEILTEQGPDTVRAMLDVIAISRGARVRGRFLINFSEEEMLEIATRTGI